MTDIKALDLSEVKTVPVRLGDRDFRITQDKRVVLQKVVAVAYGNREEPDNQTLSEALFSNWDATIGAFLLILGCEDNEDERDFLNDHLTVAKALTIFNAWWELNEMDDFFIRGGRLMMPPSLVKTIEANRPALVQEALTETIQ